MAYLQKKYEEVIKLSEEPSIDSNEGAASQMYRAMALRETEDLEAAILLLSEVIKNRGLEKAINIRSRYERALTYLKSKNEKKAIADFQFIISKDFDYLDVQEQMKKLRGL